MPERLQRGIRKVNGHEDVAHGPGRGIVRLPPHREDRTGRRPEHLFGHAANEQTLEAAAPTRARHDEVNLLLLDVPHDGLGRRLVRPLLLHEREGVQVNVRRGIPIHRQKLGQGGLRDRNVGVRPAARSVLRHVEHVQLRFVPRCEGRGVRECPLGSTRKVSRPENSANREHSGPRCVKTLAPQNVKKFFQNVNPESKSEPPSARLSTEPVDAPAGGETFYRTIN